MLRKTFSAIMLLLLMVSMLAVVYRIQPASADDVDWWPMFHHDLNHTGTSTSTGPTTNNTLWSYTTGDWVLSSPAAVGGFVYVGSMDGYVYCLNATTGAFVWNYTMGGAVYSSPAVVGGLVYVGSEYVEPISRPYTSYVYCLNATTGSLVWSYQLTYDFVDTSPAVVGGFVFVGSILGYVYCLNATTGAFVWSYQTMGNPFSSPAVVGGLVYVGSMAGPPGYPGGVYCLNAATGSLVWKCATGDSVVSSPAVIGGLVYVGSWDNNTYCLNAATGTKVWNYTTGGGDSSPAVADDLVYVGSEDNCTYCLNATTGAFVWSYRTGYWVTDSPAVAGGLVYVGSADDNVYCLNATTGTLVWNYTTGGWVVSSPAVVNGVVYAGSEDGKIYAFGPSPPLTVSISPTSVTMYVGQSQLFNSTASGGASPYSYQWYLDGAPVSGTTNPTWTFTPTTVGSYTVSLVVNDSATPPATAQSNNSSVTAVTALVYIMSDGSVVPSYAPISSNDNVTYTLAGNVSYPTYEGIVVERSNIVIDGNGYMVQGNQSGNTGLSLTGVSNVTIKNTNIKGCWGGISLIRSSGNNICGNNISNNEMGIWLYEYSSGNNISGNNIAANDLDGIWANYSSSNNVILGNNISGNNGDGIFLAGESGNSSISDNNITNNGEGIRLLESPSIEIYHNNFVSNTAQAYTENSASVWDNGYPYGGNYWSDYAGVDLYSGPYQNQTGSDGIGDTPYIIDANNTDHYPLMNPWTAPDISVTDFTTSKTVIGQGYTGLVNVTFENLGTKIEAFNATFYANSSCILTLPFWLPMTNCTLIFSWDTTGFAYGNYTISAYALPVHGETNTANNNMTVGVVLVTIPGDINGDGSVDIYDAILLSGAFGSSPGSPNWNPNADINGDGIVDIYDAIIMSGSFNQSLP